MDRDLLVQAVKDVERAEELLRPFRAAHERLQLALADAELLGTRAPEDTAAELLLALRRVRLPGARQAESVALALAQAVEHAQAALPPRDTSPGVEAKRRVP
jgi:hypothetical protein